MATKASVTLLFASCFFRWGLCQPSLCQQVCVSAGSCSGPTTCPDTSCNAAVGVNYGGALKLLDVNMFGWPAHTGRPAVATAADCCYACADTPGCNIWNFCSLPGGCGTGCTSAKFGPSTLSQEQAHSSYVPTPGNLYGPVFRFGVDGKYPYNPLQYLPQGSGRCNADGTFPFQTCTLKNAPDPSNPPTYTSAGDTDWISGAILNLATAQAAKNRSQWFSYCDSLPQGC